MRWVASTLAIAQEGDAVAVPVVIGLLDEADRDQRPRRAAAQLGQARVVDAHGDLGNEVLEQVAGECQLGEDDQRRALPRRGGQPLGEELEVGVHLTEARRHLGQRDPVFHAAQRSAA